MPVNTRTTAAARRWMTLGGVLCPNVKAIHGGGISAPVIENVPAGGGGFAEKHLGPPAYEELTVSVGLGSAADLYAWAASAFTVAPQRRDGTVVDGDANGNATSERAFTDALVTAVTFPTFDGSSKDAAYLSLTFRPERIQLRPGSGKMPAAAGGKQKAWLCSNFRLDLDGMPTARVATVDSFTVSQLIADDPVGSSRDTAKHPVRPEFPNLAVSISAADRDAWQTWFEDFVVSGNNDASKLKSGALVFLGPDMKAELGRVALVGVGICAFHPPDFEANSETIARFRVELYCQRMELHIGATAPAPAPTPEPAPAPPVIPIRPEPGPRPVVPHR